jgi:hypothetical protein
MSYVIGTTVIITVEIRPEINVTDRCTVRDGGSVPFSECPVIMAVHIAAAVIIFPISSIYIPSIRWV